MTKKIDIGPHHYPEHLPVVEQRSTIIEAIRNNQVVIIAGETGSGKTTQLPKMCLEAGLGQNKRICCTQPRRIAAFSVAARLNDELRHLGAIAGYKVRFHDRTNDLTRIKFVTDGILLAEAQSDRILAEYDTIIIDEAHERSLNIDFLLGILKRLLHKRRDLHVLISSATLDVEKFAAHFKDAPIIQVAGRSFPIETIYSEEDGALEGEEANHIQEAVGAVQKIVIEGGPGDILVFMPTEKDILEVIHGLQSLSECTTLPLFGRMAAKEQKRIFSPSKKRKIVVATNVAETSLTVPGIRFVVDSGLARISGYNARSRTTILPVRRISQASAEQRKGRCGRIGPGVCIRLYSEEDFAKRPEYTPPEIVRSNLAEVILRMLQLRLGHPASFPFIDRPSPRSIADGFKLLLELGAIEALPTSKKHPPRLSKRGSLMAQLPLDPRISRMIIESKYRNCSRETVVIAAALSVMDPRVRPFDRQKAADEAHARFGVEGSDFLAYLKIWDLYHRIAQKVKSKRKLAAFCKTNFLGFQRMREWCDIHEQLCRILSKKKGFSFNHKDATPEAVHQAILSGSLRNIALKKKKNIFIGAHGKEVMIFPGSSLFQKSGQWIMAAEFIETQRLYARTVATIDPAWIPPLAGPLCSRAYSEPHWEKKRGRVMAYEKVTLFGLLVASGRKVPYGPIHHDEARQIFIQEALVEGRCLRRYEFLVHNQALLEKYQEEEERLRRKKVIDSYGLYSFYDGRVPNDVCDVQGLEGVIQHLGQRLFLGEADVLVDESSRVDPDLFPETIQLEKASYKLSYRFSPGESDDGVTVIVPIDLLPHLDPHLFDWLVPGLLVEKITWMLKGLPKKKRKYLVPLPQTAEALARQLTFGRGSLLRELERVIERLYRVSLLPSDWQLGALPDFLKMRFCVKKKGKTVKVSRNFNELLEHKEQSGIETLFQSFKAKYEHPFNQLLGERPKERIPLTATDGQLLGFAFPGLQCDTHGEVMHTLFATEQKRDRETTKSVILLYCSEFSRQKKEFDKSICLTQGEWPLFEGLAPLHDINKALRHCVLKELFAIEPGNIPDKKRFEELLHTVRRRGYLLEGQRLSKEVKRLLAERRSCLEHVTSFEKKRSFGAHHPFEKIVQQVREHISSLFTLADLYRKDLQQLQLLERYFKGIRIRVERAYVNCEQDQAKEKLLEPYLQRLRVDRIQIMQQKRPPIIAKQLEGLVQQFIGMVEDYRLSLFAQEIKTSQPVSVKRLEKLWGEIEAVAHSGTTKVH